MAPVTAMPVAHGSSDEHHYQDKGAQASAADHVQPSVGEGAMPCPSAALGKSKADVFSRRQARRDKGRPPTLTTGAKSASNRNGWGLGWRAVRVRLQRRIHHIECWRRYAKIAAQRYYLAGEPRQLQSMAAQ